MCGVVRVEPFVWDLSLGPCRLKCHFVSFVLVRSTSSDGALSVWNNVLGDWFGVFSLASFNGGGCFFGDCLVEGCVVPFVLKLSFGCFCVQSFASDVLVGTCHALSCVRGTFSKLFRSGSLLEVFVVEVFV